MNFIDRSAFDLFVLFLSLYEVRHFPTHTHTQGDTDKEEEGSFSIFFFLVINFFFLFRSRCICPSGVLGLLLLLVEGLAGAAFVRAAQHEALFFFKKIKIFYK